MKKLLHAFRYFLTKADMILLFLCVCASVFGIVVVASATQHFGTNRNVTIQIVALLLGMRRRPRR